MGLFDWLTDTFSDPYKTAGGLRPQDDASTALLINALRGNPTAGFAGTKVPGDVSGQRIVQAALRAPGTTNVYTRPQSQDPSMEGRFESGTAGRTNSKTGEINLYPEQNRNSSDMSNTLAHELLHSVRVNTGQTHYGTGVEEAFARYGTGYPREAWLGQLTPTQRNNLTPDQHQTGMGMFMKEALGNAPATKPSQGLSMLPVPAAPVAQKSMFDTLFDKFYGR